MVRDGKKQGVHYIVKIEAQCRNSRHHQCNRHLPMVCSTIRQTRADVAGEIKRAVRDYIAEVKGRH
jgi:hypothetical protein